MKMIRETNQLKRRSGERVSGGEGDIGRCRNKQNRSEHRYLVSQFIMQSLLPPESFSMGPVHLLRATVYDVKSCGEPPDDFTEKEEEEVEDEEVDESEGEGKKREGKGIVKRGEREEKRE